MIRIQNKSKMGLKKKENPRICFSEQAQKKKGYLASVLPWIHQELKEGIKVSIYKLLFASSP